MKRLQLLYTDGNGKAFVFSDGSHECLVYPSVSVSTVRRECPKFFRDKRKREYITTYRGFVLARHGTPSGSRETVIYAFNLKDNDTYWIKSVNTQATAKRMIDRMWESGWVSVDDHKGYTCNVLHVGEAA